MENEKGLDIYVKLSKQLAGKLWDVERKAKDDSMTTSLNSCNNGIAIYF